MFELKRSEIIKESVKMNGEVITTNLNLTKNAREVIKIINELQVIQVNLKKEKEIEENLFKLGDLTVNLIKIFFGDNADKVLKFYSDETGENERTVTSDNAQEILIEVIPFLFSLLPKVHEFVKNKQIELNKQIKGRKIK